MSAPCGEVRYKWGDYCPACYETIVHMGEHEWCHNPACDWRPSMREYKKLPLAEAPIRLAFAPRGAQVISPDDEV